MPVGTPLTPEEKRANAEKWLKEKQAKTAKLRARAEKEEAAILAQDKKKKALIFGHRDHNRQLSAEPVNPSKLTRMSDFATLMQKFYAVADKAITELHNSPEFGPKEIASIAQLARTLPLLQQAEEARKTRVEEQDLKQLSTEQLYNLVDKFSHKLDAAKRKETLAAKRAAAAPAASKAPAEEEAESE